MTIQNSADRPFALTMGEVAEELQISKRQVQKLITRGDMESFKIGRSRRIRRQSLDDYVDRIAELNSPPTRHLHSVDHPDEPSPKPEDI